MVHKITKFESNSQLFPVTFGIEDVVKGPQKYKIRKQLKKFELLSAWPCCFLFAAAEYLYITELFVGNSHNNHMSLRRQDISHPLFMHISVFDACAVPYIY